MIDETPYTLNPPELPLLEVKNLRVSFVTPEGVVGIYQLQARNGQDYCRVCFAGRVPEDGQAQPRDPQILACHWLTREEIAAARPRSSIVLACLDDFQRGGLHPLGIVAKLGRDR